ncbi:MAG: helix-turn-helix transcriptional regulator [Bacillota bacterium]
MKFGRRLKEARKAKNLTQEEVAKLVGITLRSYVNYEHGNTYPRKREMYGKLATVLDIDVNCLLMENEEFTLESYKKYGPRGLSQAQNMIKDIGVLYAGGELSEEDLDAVMKSMQKLYWDAKEDNKKYTPKKYRETTD